MCWRSAVRRIAEGQANAEKDQGAARRVRGQVSRDCSIRPTPRPSGSSTKPASSSDALAQRRSQEAVTEGERIIARAREATQLEHDRVLSEVKRELGRLVIDTTAKVTGKVLTADDQARLGEETTRQIA